MRFSHLHDFKGVSFRKLYIHQLLIIVWTDLLSSSSILRAHTVPRVRIVMKRVDARWRNYVSVRSRSHRVLFASNDVLGSDHGRSRLQRFSSRRCPPA